MEDRERRHGLRGRTGEWREAWRERERGGVGHRGKGKESDVVRVERGVHTREGSGSGEVRCEAEGRRRENRQRERPTRARAANGWREKRIQGIDQGNVDDGSKWRVWCEGSEVYVLLTLSPPSLGVAEG